VMAVGVGLALLCGVTGSLFGAWRAARLHPAEAMRPAPPERAGRVLLERWPWLWARIPFRWKMTLRNIFRNPFRGAVSVFAAAVATALVVMTLCMTDSLDYLMRHQFERVSHEDITASLRDPRGVQGAEELRSLPEVALTEGHLAVPVTLTNGSRSKRTGITGLPETLRLHTPLDAEERPVAVPEGGLLLSAKLAELLDVRPGSRVRMRPLIGRRQEVETVVAGVVETYLGLSCYASIETLSRLLGEEPVANLLLLKLQPGTDAGMVLPELKRRPGVVGLGERTRSLTQMEATFGESMGSMLAIMVFFAGTIAFGSVLNTALVSLGERQRDVATLRVLGYTYPQVAMVFSGESLLLNGIGILLGLAAGVGLTELITLAYNTELFRFPAVVPPMRLVQSALLMGAAVLAAQAIIFRMIARLDWLEVMKLRE